MTREERIEAAARAIAANDCGDDDEWPTFADIARHALTAAFPELMRDAHTKEPT